MIFSDLLRKFLNFESNPPPHDSNIMSLVFVLHGLIGVMWLMKCNDAASCSWLDRKNAEWGETWSGRISGSLKAWKSRYEARVAYILVSTHDDNTWRHQFLEASTGISAMYHAANIVLNAEITDLLTAAGARSIFGREVSPEQRAASPAKVLDWAMTTTVQARNAGWHAASLLHEGISNFKTQDNICTPFHYPWCLYLATLVCWALNCPDFACPKALQRQREQQQRLNSVSAQDASDSRHPTGDSSRDVDPKVEMYSLISTMLVHDPSQMSKCVGQHRTEGLLSEMTKLLSRIRWIGACEAVATMRDLLSRNKEAK